MDTDKDTAAPAPAQLRAPTAQEADTASDGASKTRAHACCCCSDGYRRHHRRDGDAAMVRPQRNRPADASVGRQGVVTAPPLMLVPPAAQAPLRAAQARLPRMPWARLPHAETVAWCRWSWPCTSTASPNQAATRCTFAWTTASTRTVEQRGALAAGSRVLVEGKSVSACCRRRSPAAGLTCGQSRATCRTSLPKFSPVNSFIKASGNVSRPCTTSSLLFMRPSFR